MKRSLKTRSLIITKESNDLPNKLDFNENVKPMEQKKDDKSKRPLSLRLNGLKDLVDKWDDGTNRSREQDVLSGQNEESLVKKQTLDIAKSRCAVNSSNSESPIVIQRSQVKDVTAKLETGIKPERPVSILLAAQRLSEKDDEALRPNRRPKLEIFDDETLGQSYLNKKPLSAISQKENFDGQQQSAKLDLRVSKLVKDNTSKDTVVQLGKDKVNSVFTKMDNREKTVASKETFLSKQKTADESLLQKRIKQLECKSLSPENESASNKNQATSISDKPWTERLSSLLQTRNGSAFGSTTDNKTSEMREPKSVVSKKSDEVSKYIEKCQRIFRLAANMEPSCSCTFVYNSFGKSRNKADGVQLNIKEPPKKRLLNNKVSTNCPDTKPVLRGKEETRNTLLKPNVKAADDKRKFNVSDEVLTARLELDRLNGTTNQPKANVKQPSKNENNMLQSAAGKTQWSIDRCKTEVS